MADAVRRAARAGGHRGVFIFLGQAGTSVRGAYDALVSMGIIAYFIPFLFMFAAMIKLQREPAGPDVIRVPGGAPVARLLASLGFVVTAISIVLACVPAGRRAEQDAGGGEGRRRRRSRSSASRCAHRVLSAWGGEGAS